MKKTILFAGLTLLLAGSPATGQMMEGGQMMEPQQMQRNPQAIGQYNPQYMNPGMMGNFGYSYGMMPNVMSYGMMPGTMGYGMGPSMMGGYGMFPNMMGYGMGPSMMGGYGTPNMMAYGMGSAMMGGYDMSNMMGYGYDPRMMGPETEKQYKETINRNNRFLDATRELRKKLHILMFEYQEALRSASGPDENLDKMRREMFDLQQKIYNKNLQTK